MTENKAVPKLRFRDFDDDWIKKSLRNCTIKIGSGSTPRGGDKTYLKDGKVHFIRSQNVVNNELVLTDDVFISDKTNSKMKGSIVKPNDILLNITGGSIGRSCVVPSEFSHGNVNQHVCIIRLDNQVHPYFLQPFLASQRGQKLIKRGQTGSGREGLNFQSIALFKLNIPSIDEQNKIASFLTTLDKKVQQLTKKKKLLEDYKKGIMQKIFSQEIRFKDDNGNEYPDWEEKKLGQIGTFISGTGFSNSEQGGVKGIPFLKVSDMNLKGNEYSITNANNYVNKEQISRLKYKVINNFSIIFAKVGAAIFLERKRIASNFLIDNNMMSFTPSGNIIFFKNLFEMIRLSKFAQVGALPSYNASDLKTIKIVLPKSSDEQEKIGEFLSEIDKKIKLVNNQLEKTKEFKKGLLQQMFV